MKLYLCIAAVLVALVSAPGRALAECYSSQAFVNGTLKYCTTCCTGGERCQTVCY